MTAQAKSVAKTTKKTTKAAEKTVESTPASSDLVAANTTFTLTIPADMIAAAREKVIAKAQRGIKVDGFRAGKVPLKVVEQRLGETDLMQLTAEEVLPKAYTAAVEAHKFVPLTDPDVKPGKMEVGQDWTFEVTIATMPEIDVSSYVAIIEKLKKSNELWTKEDKDKKPEEVRQDRLQAILSELVREIKVSVPELLLRKETERQLHELSHQLEQLNLKVDDYLVKVNKKLEDVQQEFAIRALGMLQVEILLARIINEKKITADVKEVEEAVHARHNHAPGEEHPVSREEVDYIHSTLLKQKAIEHLLTI